jgi:hypothetical protein
VLIKVAVSGSNPKDWKTPEFTGSERNEGDDIAGIVEKVGSNVTEFKQGDRVAAFHETRTPHGSYAEYSIAPQHTTFHIPQKTSFEGKTGELCYRQKDEGSGITDFAGRGRYHSFSGNHRSCRPGSCASPCPPPGRQQRSLCL